MGMPDYTYFKLVLSVKRKFSWWKSSNSGSEEVLELRKEVLVEVKETLELRKEILEMKKEVLVIGGEELLVVKKDVPDGGE